MAQVFISYSRKDLGFVKQLAADLKNAGYAVWYDVSGIRGGSQWLKEIEEGLRSSQFAIVVLSPDSIVSEWVEREFLFASNRKLKIIPLYYRRCELPLSYLNLNYIDVQGDKYRENFNEILSSIGQTPASLPAKPLSKNKLQSNLVVFSVALAAIVITIGSYLLPRWHSQQKQDDSENINMSVSVMQDESSASLSKSDTHLDYEISRPESSIEITPYMGYFELLEKGGPIEPISYIWVPFEWDFPVLDIKVVNNSNKTIFLTEALFNIEESILDPTPVLLIRPDDFRRNALHFPICNEGWGPAKDLRIEFHLAPLDAGAEARYNTPYTHILSIGDIDECFNVDLSQAFVDSGVNLSGLQSLRIVSYSYGGENGGTITYLDKTDAEVTVTVRQFETIRKSFLGDYEEGGAVVSGEMIYDSISLQGKPIENRIKFSTIVWLFDENLAGVPAPPTYEYGTRFQVTGKNYERRVNISQQIKPGETDRFTIKIGVDKSSLHKFSFSLLYNNSVIGEQKIVMRIFVPRSGAEYVH